MARKKKTVSDQNAAKVDARVAALHAINEQAASISTDLQGELDALLSKYSDRIQDLDQKIADISQFDLIEELGEKLSNLEEKFSNTDRYQTMSDFKDSLDNAVSGDELEEVMLGDNYDFDAVLDSLNGVTRDSESQITSLESVEIP